jgi:rfaE bifunctional protein kinase chain/domain
LDETRLKVLLASFRKRRILVVGDFYLDAYWILDKTLSTLSLETPWHTNPVVDQRYSPGAAGTVTNNLRALEIGTVYTLSVIGQDGFGMALLDKLNTNNCRTDFMISSPTRVTPTYLKPMHRGYEGVAVEGPRFDIENHAPMKAELEEQVIHHLRECVQLVEAVIIGDQTPHDNLGVITDRVREEMVQLSETYPEKIFFADSRQRIGLYRNIIIKPNRFEAKRAVEPGWRGTEVTIAEAQRCGEQLYQRMGQPVYVTVGEKGILVITAAGCQHVPAIKITGELDPVGAGDSVSAGIVATLSSGGSDREAAEVGNLVASITVTKIGTTGTASHDEIMTQFRNLCLQS